MVESRLTEVEFAGDFGDVRDDVITTEVEFAGNFGDVRDHVITKTRDC